MVDTGTKTGRVAFAAALAAVVIGATVLAGWLFEVEFLKRIASGLVAMNPATAVAFVLAGTSLALFLQSPRGRDQKSRALILTARLCALVVALIGLAKLAGILSGWDLGVDRWLFASKLPDGLQFPNRMAPNAALNFLLLGGALLLVDVKNRSVRLCVEFSVVVVGFVSLLAILGHVYDVQSFYRLGDSIPMALHTVITFSMLSVAFLLSHTDGGLLAVFAGDSAGGTMARRLLPAAVLVPAGLGWLTLQGKQAEIYSGEIGEAVFAVANILVFTFLICWSAKGLFSADLRRKKDEEALRESAAFLEAQVNCSIDGMLVVSQDGTKSLQNQRFVDLLKIPQSIADEKSDENRLRWVTDMMKNPDRFAEKVRYLYDHPAETSRDEVELKDGTVLDRYSSPVIGQDGRYYGRIWTFRDITERKQASALLMESEQRLALATESAHIGIWDWDVVTNKLVWDQQMYALYGIREQDFSGAYDAWQKGLHPEDRERAEADITVAVHDANGFHVEFRVLWPNGEVRHIEAHALVRRADDGSTAHMIGVNWDITERKRLEGQLFQSQKMETVGKLAGGIAHEFNSILTAIIGQSELLLADLPSGSPLAKNATEISKAADRAATLTRQLLAYGRKQFLRPETLNLNQVIAEHGRHVSPSHGRRRGHAHHSRHRLARGKSGRRTDRTGHHEPGHQRARRHAQRRQTHAGNRQRLVRPGERGPLSGIEAGRLRDAGDHGHRHGHEREVKARVFEPFFTTKDVGQGTGLGLSTCYGIIKQSGGHISVYSEPGAGHHVQNLSAASRTQAKTPDPRA